MRTSKVLVAGAVLGAAVAWLWGRQIGEYVQARTRSLRMKAVEGVQAVEEKAGTVLDRGADALHRVDDFVQGTKRHVSEALRTGQDREGRGPSS